MSRLFYQLLLCCSLFMFLSIYTLHAQNYVLDESYRDTSFLWFKSHLIKVLLDKDKTALLKMVHTQVKENAYGGPLAPADLEQTWFKDELRANQFWKSALKTMSFGFRCGAIYGKKASKSFAKTYYAPSFLKDIPYDAERIDYQDTTPRVALVLGERVNCRKA